MSAPFEKSDVEKRKSPADSVSEIERELLQELEIVYVSVTLLKTLTR